jgi:hypothetical protein
MRFQKGTSGNPAGMKRKQLTAANLATVTQLASRGCREADIARAVGMCDITWAKYKRDFPATQAALDAGRQIMHDALIGKLYEKAMKGDTVSLIFACKILLGYRENEVQVEFKPQINITLPGALPLEKFTTLQAEGQKLLAKEARRG